MIDEKDYSDLIDEEYAFPHPFHFLWSHISDLVTKPKYAHLSSFANRRDLFLWVLKRLLDENKVAIGHDGKINSSNAADIIESFKKAFPKAESDMENGIWFLSFPEKCPGAAVWIVEKDMAPLYCSPTTEGKFYYWT